MAKSSMACIPECPCYDSATQTCQYQTLMGELTSGEPIDLGEFCLHSDTLKRSELERLFTLRREKYSLAHN